MESLICSACGKCSGIIQVSQSGLQKFVCDQCSSDQTQANRIPVMKAVETMRSEYYNQVMISLKHHESILISFKSQMMQFRSELENILHLTFDKSIKDLDELSLEIQKKCKVVETIQDTEKEHQVHTSQTAHPSLQDIEIHSKEALIGELDAESHGKDVKSNKCLTESQIFKEVQTSKVDDDTLPQYEQKIRDLEQKLDQLNALFDQKERETLELSTQVETIKQESATKDMKLLGLKNLNEAMIQKLHQRDSEVLQLKSKNNTEEGMEIARLRSQVEDLDKQIITQQGIMTQLEATTKDLEMKLSAKDDIISQLEAKSNDLEYKTSSKDSEISQQISELQVAASKLADRESEIAKLSSEYETISKVLLAKDSEISQYSSKLDYQSQLLSRFKSVKSVLISLLAECRDLKHDNLNLRQEVIRYNQEATTSYLQVSPCLQQIKELQLHNSRIPGLESTIQTLTNQNQILEKELRDLQRIPLIGHEIEALNVSYEKQTQILNDLEVEEKDNLEKIHLEKLRYYENQLAEQEKIHIEKVKYYESQLSELEKLKQYEEKMNQYEDSISSLLHQTQESTNEINRLRSIVDIEKSSYDQLKSLYNQSLQEFEHKLKGKEDEISNLSGELKQIISENLANIQAVSALNSENKQLTNTLESTQSSFKSLEFECKNIANNQSNLRSLNFSQALKVERLNMGYEDLNSQFMRSHDGYEDLNSDLKNADPPTTSTDRDSTSWCLESILEELRYPSVVNTIHIAKRGTRSLVSYDVSTQESTTYLLTNITHNFKYTSTCALSNGDVMIAGGCHPTNGDAYLFRYQNKQCYKLASLNHPRGFISLIYHNKKVYAFGGSNVAATKKAEEYNIATNEWRELPDMLQAREGASCVSLRDNIYIIGGGITSIEEFSIDKRAYRMMGLSVSRYGNVGAVVNDKVYIIGHSDLIIANSSLALVNTMEKRWEKLVILLSNVCIEDGSIWYYNHWTSRVESLSLITYERKDLASL
jgi:hypothetical protein